MSDNFFAGFITLYGRNYTSQLGADLAGMTQAPNGRCRCIYIYKRHKMSAVHGTANEIQPDIVRTEMPGFEYMTVSHNSFDPELPLLVPSQNKIMYQNYIPEYSRFSGEEISGELHAHDNGLCKYLTQMQSSKESFRQSIAQDLMPKFGHHKAAMIALISDPTVFILSHCSAQTQEETPNVYLVSAKNYALLAFDNGGDTHEIMRTFYQLPGNDGLVCPLAAIKNSVLTLNTMHLCSKWSRVVKTSRELTDPNPLFVYNVMHNYIQERLERTYR